VQVLMVQPTSAKEASFNTVLLYLLMVALHAPLI
jgi:hypothetical protein